MSNTFQIVINGRVQGVGFRPHVYLLAKKLELKGSVSNNQEGVIIFLNGPVDKVDEFITRLIESPPSLSRIDNHSIAETPFVAFDDFRIVPSVTTEDLNLQLTPDFALCEDCRHELLDPGNRRHNYPFITCVNCGPRWTITRGFPFERVNTSIDEFKMCKLCNTEYVEPSDRRFHSQTNSCGSCGISYQLCDASGKLVIKDDPAIFNRIAQLLSQGQIVAIKNITGYLLCCDATNSKAIKSLRKRKNRPNKPFAVLYPSMDFLKTGFALHEKEIAALSSVENPIVILQNTGSTAEIQSPEIAPGLNQTGVMLPYSGLLQLLAEALDFPVVATSGNLHGSPIISDNRDAEELLAGVADYFLHHDLPVVNPQDDSVIKFTKRTRKKLIFRRSRGYAPNYDGRLKKKVRPVMAMGAQLKSTIAFIPNEYLYISQYLGNLENFNVANRFRENVEKFRNIFGKSPRSILTDAHPGYESTRFGLELSGNLGADVQHIQHHKAHFASVLGEHSLFTSEEPVLGIVWDGTGYGDDGNIWGGEFFSYDHGRIDRVGHLKYFDWLAGDKMAKEPRLSLLSIASAEMDTLLLEKFTEEELRIYYRLREANSLKTSSVGRLFDAVASLLDIADRNTFEGEAAMLMEAQADEYDLNKCQCYVTIDETSELDASRLLKELFLAKQNSISNSGLIHNFLYTLVRAVYDFAQRERYSKICFSGGVFQNGILVDMMQQVCGEKFGLYFHKELSPNDENIAHGQLMYYLNCKE